MLVQSRIRNFFNLRFVRSTICVLSVVVMFTIFIQYRLFLRSQSQLPFADATPKEPSVYVHMGSRNDGLKSSSINDTWIVVTSISNNYFHIEKLVALGTKVVVVGDLKTPKDWKFPGCIFLSVDDQKKLGYSIIDHIPYNSYTRKNIGYLYAIANGAKFIFDTDDDNHPTAISGKPEEHLNFRQAQFSSGLVYDADPNTTVVNPYVHFGQESMWPRGYPLDAIGQTSSYKYSICKTVTPAVQQGLVNGDPDVDAIFRLTRKSAVQNLNITFDSRAPHVVLPSGIFAPYNSQNTFHTYEALWALVLPASVAFRVTDIWRGYWAQTLLWQIGQNLAFFPPNAVQVRNSHSYMNDFIQEDQVYKDTGNLVAFLKQWKCELNRFFECATDLAFKMAANGFWNQSDALLITAWISDLKRVGYSEPDLVTTNNKTPCIDEQHAVIFSPVSQKSSAINQIYVPANPSGSRYLQNFCSSDSQWNYNSLDPTPSISHENILMVIVFNSPHYNVIPILGAMYRQHFPNIAFCGNVANDWDQFYLDLRKDTLGSDVLERFTMINVTYTRGFFAYDCLLRAMEMDYEVDGFLVLGDDLLFNFWHMNNFNSHGVFLQRTPDYHTIDKRAKSSNWTWWVSEVLGKGAINRALDNIDDIVNNDENTTYFAKVLYNVTMNRALKDENIVTVAVTDLYYVPRHKANEIYYTLVMFRREQVFVEIAIPTALSSCGLDVSFFNGSSLWNSSRVSDPMKYYSEDDYFLHPVKLGVVLKDQRFKDEYCKKYVEDAISNW